MAGEPGPVVEPAEVVRDHGATLILIRPKERRTCSGDASDAKKPDPPKRGVLYRLPKEPGAVYLVLVPCPPCVEQ